MGRTVEDLELAARAVIGRRGSDKFYFPAPIPYRDVQLPKKLKFGYYLMDGLVKVSPVCKRAVLETVKALRANGHECVEFAVPSRMRLFLIPFTQSDLQHQSGEMYRDICCSDLRRWLPCCEESYRVRSCCEYLGAAIHPSDDKRPLGTCHVFDLVGSTYLGCAQFNGHADGILIL